MVGWFLVLFRRHWVILDSDRDPIFVVCFGHVKKRKIIRCGEYYEVGGVQAQLAFANSNSSIRSEHPGFKKRKSKVKTLTCDVSPPWNHKPPANYAPLSRFESSALESPSPSTSFLHQTPSSAQSPEQLSASRSQSSAQISPP